MTIGRRGGGGGGGGGITDISSGYEVMFPLKIFKTIFPSLLIRFFWTIDGKYKINKWIFHEVYLKMFLIQNYWGWG